MNVTDSNPAAERLQPIGERRFQPLADRLLVRRLPDVDGLISYPDAARVPAKHGVVVAVGFGRRDSDGHRTPLCVKVGDHIQFGRFTDFDDGELLLIQEADIVGIIEEE